MHVCVILLVLLYELFLKEGFDLFCTALKKAWKMHLLQHSKSVRQIRSAGRKNLHLPIYYALYESDCSFITVRTNTISGLSSRTGETE